MAMLGDGHGVLQIADIHASSRGSLLIDIIN
jgi:hypothetical protein